MFNRRAWHAAKPSRTLTWILALAFLLRLALVLFVLTHYGPSWFFSRGSEMGLLADSLLHHHGLSSPFGPNTGPTAMVAPGYPLIVAGTFAGLGSFTWQAALVLMLLNALCNTATVYLIAKLGRSFASEGPACIFVLFWACSLPLLWMPTIFWETSLSSLLMVGAVACMLAVQQERSLRFWCACGVLCGISGLINPALLPSFVLLIFATLIRTSTRQGCWSRLGICAFGLVLAYSPWPLRNARAFHALILTRTTVGMELWMGNHPGSTGFLEEAQFPTYNAAELAMYRRQGEVLYFAHKANLARVYIFAHPMKFARLTGLRCLRFWVGQGTRGGSGVFTLHAALSSCLGLGGLVLLWRRDHKRICFSTGLLLVLFPLPYYLTHAEFRYRLVVDPLLTALGAPAVQWLLNKLPVTAGKRAETGTLTRTRVAEISGVPGR